MIPRLASFHPVFKTCGLLHLDLRVVLEFERRTETKNTNTRKRKGTKGRELLQIYPEKKAHALMARLRKAGMWYWDPDFDQDEEEREVGSPHRVPCSFSHHFPKKTFV